MIYSELTAALDDAVLAATEHQIHFASTIGTTPKWRLSTENATAEFITRNGLILTATVHPIGIFRQQHWTWAWSDERISEPRRDAVNQIHAFGHAHNIPVLSTPTLNLGDWRTRITPNLLCTATKIIHRLWHHFAFPMPDGSALYAGLNFGEHLTLPAPSRGAVTQTIRSAETLFTIRKQRRALTSYTNIRGITRQETADHQRMLLHLNDGDLLAIWQPDSIRLAAP